MPALSPRLTRAQLQRRIDAAQGRIPCDWVLRGFWFLDVFSCTWIEGDVAFVDGAIVGVEPGTIGLKGKRELDGRAGGKRRWLVPGFIDAHVHVESSLLVPRYFEKAVLPRGTTTAICDPHELSNVQGIEGLRYFLDEASQLTPGSASDAEQLRAGDADGHLQRRRRAVRAQALGADCWLNVREGAGASRR